MERMLFPLLYPIRRGQAGKRGSETGARGGTSTDTADVLDQSPTGWIVLKPAVIIFSRPDPNSAVRSCILSVNLWKSSNFKVLTFSLDREDIAV